MCTYLDVVPLVVVAAFSEEAVVHDVMDIELIEEGVAVLIHQFLSAEGHVE